MSYLVLARKYRPQTFADLVGQEQVSRTLQNALATGRVAHAYLFSGPRGVGKTTAARLLAMSLSCLAENVADRPCGECVNCLEIQSGQAVDVIEVDGASNRGINEIRDLRETVKYLPAKSRYKVYIIDEVHALTKDAFNALLKTLEEPPPHVVFIFATTETHKVLPTILSRCQRYDFRRIRVEDIAARLARVAEMENIEAEPLALEIIARQAEGGLRDSLSLMDQAIAAGGGGALTAEDVRLSLGLIDQTLVRTIVGETLAGQGADALAALDEAHLRGYDFKDLGLKILEYIRGLTLIKVDRKNAAALNITESEENDFAGTASAYTLETLHRHFEAWLKFQRDLAYSPQPRWLLEAQVVRLSQLAPLMPVSELVERLGRLLSHNPPPPRPDGRNFSGAAVAESAAPMPRPAPPLVPAADSRPAPINQPAAAARDSTAGPIMSRPADWEAFLRDYGDRINGWARNKLTGSTATLFTPEAVTVVMRPGEPLLEFLFKQLEEENLLPLLKEAFGVQPILTIEQPRDSSTDADYLAGRLEKIKQDPEVQNLMSELPGFFTEFRITPPGENIAAEEAEETEETDDEPTEQDLSDGSLDNDLE